jgi:hypothetical protein
MESVITITNNLGCVHALKPSTNKTKVKFTFHLRYIQEMGQYSTVDEIVQHSAWDSLAQWMG